MLNAIYNHYCYKQGVPVSDKYIQAIEEYEDEVTSKENKNE